LAVSVDGETLTVVVPDLGLPPHIMDWLIVDGRPYEIVVDRDLHWIKANKGLHRLEVRDLEAADARPASRDGRIKAPIPGLIARVLVEPAAQVAAGQPLLLLEAMKMENEIRAPFAGTVTSLNVQAGQEVALNQLLAEISGTLP
jgi:acetyl/propionyl-CoA carboxylase alpha subunit